MTRDAGWRWTERARIESWIPGIRVARTYERTWLSRDLIAGIVLVTLLVPQGMAYAELAGLPPITGLYTTVVCLIAYALVGPSPVLVLGPDSALGPMIAATILPLAGGDEQQAIALAGMLALLVGAVTVGAGIAKLGFVADLLSNPVRIGYLAGLAVVILIGQLPKLFGFKVDADGLVDELVAFVQNLDKTNPWALGIGLLSLAIILGLQRVAPQVPGILVAVVVSIALSIVARPRRPRGVGHRRAAAGIPGAVAPARDPVGHPAPVRGRRRDLAGRDRRHHLDVRRLRRAERLRGQRQPGAGRDRLGQPRGRPVLRLPGEHERLADGGGLAVGRQDPADRPRRGEPGPADAPRRARPRPGDAAAGPGRGHHRRVAEPVRRRRRCGASTRCAGPSSPWPSRAASGSRSSASSRGSSSP